MSWIHIIPYHKSHGKLRTIYDRIKGKNGQIDNVLGVHSLRPHTLTGHMNLYKNVLHHRDNTFPKWFLEYLGVWTSYLNHCDYCVDHHFEGMRRLLSDDRAVKLKLAMETENWESVGLEIEQCLLIEYAKRLTLDPKSISKDLIEEIKDQGISDGEILEVNQVVAYFNYANRTVLGLGVSTNGEILGLSPNDSDDTDSWTHN